MNTNIIESDFIAWLESKGNKRAGNPCAWLGPFAEYLRENGERNAIEIAIGQVSNGAASPRFGLPEWAAVAQAKLWSAAIVHPKRMRQGTGGGMDNIDACVFAMSGIDCLIALRA